MHIYEKHGEDDDPEQMVSTMLDLVSYPSRLLRSDVPAITALLEFLRRLMVTDI